MLMDKPVQTLKTEEYFFAEIENRKWRRGEPIDDLTHHTLRSPSVELIDEGASDLFLS